MRSHLPQILTKLLVTGLCLTTCSTDYLDHRAVTWTKKKPQQNNYPSCKF